MFFLFFFALLNSFDAKASLPDLTPSAVGIRSGPYLLVGSGVWVTPQLVLTVAHVPEKRAAKDLTIISSKGQSTAVNRSIIRSIPAEHPEYEETLDISFLFTSDAIGTPTPWSTDPEIGPHTIMLSYLLEHFFIQESMINQVYANELVHCVKGIRGFSGSPVFNEKGELIAVHTGIIERTDLNCPNQNYVSRAVPLFLLKKHFTEIFSEADRLLLPSF